MGAPASAPFPGNSFVILSVSVVGILATSLLLLAYYLFLTRCGFASWRRGDHDHDVVAATQLHVYSPAPARRGLEDAAIRRIPTFRYRNKPLCQAKVAAAASECAVCLSEFSDGERLRLLPPCLHAFHIDCIDAWLHATANCPICRASVSGSGSACPPHVNHVEIDIVTALQADAAANANANADAVVIDIVSPSPADMAGGRSGDAGGTSGGGKMSMRDDQCIDLRRDDDGDMLSGVQQPMRRSLSMDSCNDRQFYLALQKVLRQHHSAVLGEDGKAGESSAAAAVAGSRASGRLWRSFFSFSQSRSSRSAVLPI